MCFGAAAADPSVERGGVSPLVPPSKHKSVAVGKCAGEGESAVYTEHATYVVLVFVRFSPDFRHDAE